MSQYFDPDTSERLYTQIPLTPEHESVRLLTLEPGSWSQPISFTLHQTSLDNAPPYTALSYTWANNNGNSESRLSESEIIVECNGVPIGISPNLLAALARLRDETDPVQLWVDKICINQKDHQERSHQVGMMRNIYQKAKTVFIWLGENEELDDFFSTDNISNRITWHGDARDKPKWASFLAMQSARNRGNLFDLTTHDDFGAFCVIWLLSVGVEASHIPHLRHIAESVTLINGLEAIMTKAWWSRTWVVQETVVPEDAVVCYGNMTAPWHMFARAAISYNRGRLTTSAESVYPYLSPLAHFSRVIIDIQRTRYLWKHESRPTTLLPLLRMFRSRQATDPRDKVFALVGLVQHWGGSAQIIPDYNLDSEQVFQQTTTTLIKNMKSLSVLMGTTQQFTIAESYSLGRPSWLTDWSVPPEIHENTRLANLRHYNSSKGLPPGPVSCHGTSLLQVHGFEFDTIARVASEFPLTDRGTAGRWREAVFDWNKSLSDLIGIRPLVYPGGGTYPNAFWRTLCGDIEHLGHQEAGQSEFRRATQDCATAYAEWRSNAPDIVQRRTTSIVGGYWQESPGKTSLDAEAAGVAGSQDSTQTTKNKEHMRNAFHHAVEIASGGRRFFMTKRGYVGTGPREMKAGDAVAILYGSRAPFILRKSPATERSTCRGAPVESLISTEPAPMIRAGATASNTMRRMQQQTIVRCSEVHGDCFSLVGDAYVHGIMDGQAVGAMFARRNFDARGRRTAVRKMFSGNTMFLV